MGEASPGSVRHPHGPVLAASVLGLGLATILAAATVIAAPEVTRVGPPDGLAWIDAPLPGSHVPPQLLTVTAHATDAHGVAAVELYVDGVREDVVVPEDPQTLVTVGLTWLDPALGGHWLAVRGRDPDGTLGRPAYAFVFVDGALRPGPAAASPSPRPDDRTPTRSARPTPTPTPRATPTRTRRPRATPKPTPRPTRRPRATPKPTPRPTPRPTPCTPRPPLLLRPADDATITGRTEVPPTFEWGYRQRQSCRPSGYRIEITTDRTFRSVVVEDVVGARTTSYTPSRLADCTDYLWRVTPRRADGRFGSPSEVSRFRIRVTRC
jgi:hypothetical protein